MDSGFPVVSTDLKVAGGQTMMLAVKSDVYGIML